MWNLQTHGSLEDNSLHRVTYRAETGALRFCGKSTSAWENRVGVHNKVESPALDGYFLSALFETPAINALLAERSNFCHSCWFKRTVRAATSLGSHTQLCRLPRKNRDCLARGCSSCGPKYILLYIVLVAASF